MNIGHSLLDLFVFSLINLYLFNCFGLMHKEDPWLLLQLYFIILFPLFELLKFRWSEI